MKFIAFYLPQFHEIPENNIWWGQGFTEWTNTKKASPLYFGHHQPKTPSNDYYYNLLDIDVMPWQIDLAKQHGVYGFCFYHYWFGGGKKLLEKPVENFLQNRELNMPFCLSWANEPWSRRWDGSEHQVLMAQDYGAEAEWEAHFNYLLPFFRDERYIKEGGKPVFIIYKPDEIPHIDKMLAFWQILSIKHDIPGIHFGHQHPQFILNGGLRNENFSFGIEFEPLYTMMTREGNVKYKKVLKLLFSIFHNPKSFIRRMSLHMNKIIDFLFSKSLKFRLSCYNLYDYKFFVKYAKEHNRLSNKVLPGVFVAWDNTARRGSSATIVDGSTPELFREYIDSKCLRRDPIILEDYIFVNAWNEWAEGAYLEPDDRNGLSYLMEIKSVVKERTGKNSV